MKKLAIVVLVLLALVFAPRAARSADDSKVKAATEQVQQGARKIGDGEVTAGATETAKGLGNTVVEGSKYAGEKLRESGQAAQPTAKTAWTHARESAAAFGQSVSAFFARLFSQR